MDFINGLFLVPPFQGGIGGIVHPLIDRKNATYIPLIVLARTWGVIGYIATYHLLGEPDSQPLISPSWFLKFFRYSRKGGRAAGKQGNGTCRVDQVEVDTLDFWINNIYGVTQPTPR